jgi:hypothetical protein
MGVVNTTYTFSGTDTITSSKLNNIIDDTTFTSDAIQGTTLQVVSPGKLAVSAGGITSNELASNSVITDKIADSSITTAKIASSTSTTTGVTTAKIANSAITEEKIADATITPAKLSNSDFGAFTVASGVATLDDNSVTTSKITNANITAAKLDSGQTGTAPACAVRAYGGITASFLSRTIAAGSVNLASASRAGSTSTTVNFSIAMPNANYFVIGTDGVFTTAKTTTNFTITHPTETSFFSLLVIG